MLAAWYLATGRRGMQLDPPVRLGEIYVWVAIPLVVLTMIVTPAGSVLLFGMYPQVWSLLTTGARSRPAPPATSNTETGRHLHISEATVKSHLLHVFAKLGVSDRTAAATVALARGLLPPPC